MKLIAILGPTASGKTELAIKLAKRFHGEIISADSRQIYRGMDIGTAKATKRHRQQVPHHLIDTKTPRQSYTVAHFLRNARRTIRKISARGRLPFLVGGTGLYLYALLQGLNIPKVKPNPRMRHQLEKLSAEKLFRLLKKLNPARASTIDRHNPRRLIRAIEIAKDGGLKTSATYPSVVAATFRSPFDTPLILGLKIPKTKLRQNINRRVDQMFRQGLVSEVKKLIKKYGRRKIFSETIGYREVMDYLDKKITLQEARDQIKKNTWRFQRHQYNWFRRLPVVWIKNERQAEAKINKFLFV